jgi:hypothetical protein
MAACRIAYTFQSGEFFLEQPTATFKNILRKKKNLGPEESSSKAGKARR